MARLGKGMRRGLSNKQKLALRRKRQGKGNINVKLAPDCKHKEIIKGANE